MEKVCKKHQDKPAIMYGQCIGCELDGLHQQLKLVQGHAKSALDKLPERWNMGFQAGLKQAIPYEKELTDALAAERKARQDDNATLTADNLALEDEIAELRAAIGDLMVEYEIPASDYLKRLVSR